MTKRKMVRSIHPEILPPNPDNFGTSHRVITMSGELTLTWSADAGGTWKFPRKAIWMSPVVAAAKGWKYVAAA